VSKSYAELLKDPRWQKIRLEVFQRADWQCQQCSDKTTELHVHHTFYDGREPWEYPENSLKCLCKTCHNSEHFKKDENATIEEEGVEEVDAKEYCCGVEMSCSGDYYECKKCGTNFTQISKRGWETDDEYKGRAALQLRMEERMEADRIAALEDDGWDDDGGGCIPYHLINPEDG